MNIKHRLVLSMLFVTFVSILSAKSVASHMESRYGMSTDQDSTDNPPVSFKDGSGKVLSVSDLKGKVVFINFWATWCPPCIEEMPALNTLKSKFDGNDNIVFLFVDVDGKYEQAQEFMDKRNLSLPVYVPQGEIPQLYLSRGIPTTIIIDKKGEIVSRIEGGRDYTQARFEKALNNLINED